MKRNKIKKVISVLLMLSVSLSALTACGGKDEELENVKAVANKPTRITLLSDTFQENGREEVCSQYKQNTGIQLEIETPDHSTYYEVMSQKFADGTIPNVIEIGSGYYPNYASTGKLWDMTSAYENSTSAMKSVIDQDYVDALKIDGKLYGFPMTKGNGTVTYVREDWLNAAGISEPKNYSEFINMLKAFKSKGTPMTAAGVINSGYPYTLYLPQFYQGANPDIYQNDAGEYVDGMTEENMKAALKRLQDAYKDGLFDTEIVTNDTSTARDKFSAGNVGAIPYWAGPWNKKLEDKIKKLDANASVKAIAPITEAQYIERPPTVLAITNSTNNKSGVYEWFIEYTHDGGEGQMLFTHGVEGIHWAYNEDGVTASALPSQTNQSKLFDKTWFDAELSVTNNNDPITIDAKSKASLELFDANSYIAPLSFDSTEVEADLAAINDAKKTMIASATLGEITPDEAIERYKTRVGTKVESVLEKLNSKR